MNFAETLASIRPCDRGFTADIGEGWSQGRAIFGGMVAALGNEAMRRIVQPERALRALEVTFAGPLLTGGVRIDTDILRVGKAVTIAQARLFSADVIACTLTGIYGSARPAAISIRPVAPSGVPSVESLPDSRLPSGYDAPIFLNHFDVRWAEGSRPFSGSTLNHSKAYIRHRDAATLTESHVVALIDCIPTPVMQMMTKPAPSSSLTWTLEFFRHDLAFAPDGWWRVDTEVKSAGDGYASQTSLVLDPSGTPAAFSRQLVAVFG